MKKNLMKTFQSILSCITVFTLIVGIMAGGAFAKYEDYTLEELINEAMSLSESEKDDLLNELTQEDLDRFRNEAKNLSIRERGKLVLKLISDDDLAKFMREVLLTDSSYYLTIEDLKRFIKNRIQDPIERLIAETIFLSMEERREAFLEFITEFEKYLKELTKENYMTYAILLSEKLPNMTKEDIGKALNKIADYSLSRKDDFINLLKHFGAVEFDLDTTGFRGIAADINMEITGDSYDDFGIKLVFSMIDILSTLSYTPSVRDDDVDPYKVKIYANFLGEYKEKVNKVVGFLDVFKRRGVTDIDQFFNYLTNTINRHDDMEIYYFKKEVREQLGKRRYDGELLKPEEPTETPTEEPTETPTEEPTETPTEEPTETPTEEPTETPTEEPTETPTEEPTETPTEEPTETPTEEPTETPTEEPTETPTEEPTETPTEEPTDEPTQTPKPTKRPPSGGGKVVSTPTPTATPTPDVEEPVEPEVPGVPEINFTDIDGHWAREIILKLAEMGIVSGYPDGTIRPDASITRAEMAVIVVHAAGLKPAEKINLKFDDSAQIPEWAAGFIQTAVENNIIVGYEDNTFRAARELSREEMVVLILKAFDIAVEKGLEPPAFLDAEDIGSWSIDYIAKSVELSIVKGYPDNTFKPKKDVTRAEAFVVLYNTMLDRGLIPSDDEEAKDDDVNKDDSEEKD
ncbi:MAG: hypothetical protein GX387_12070, partial [Clostridium sp.]|nr:hypothetical protein [Clostridium sp.]